MSERNMQPGRDDAVAAWLHSSIQSTTSSPGRTIYPGYTGLIEFVWI